MATNTHTRRRVLAAMGALPVAAMAVPALGQTGTADTAAWDRALAGYRRAEEAFAERDKAFCAACDRYQEAKPSLGMIEWRRVGFHAYRNEQSARTFDIEADWQDFLSQENRTWWARDPERTKAEYRAALDTFTEWRRLDDEAKEATGFNRTAAALDEAIDERSEADFALMDTPAPHGPALLFKLEKLLEVDGDGSCAGWGGRYIAQTMADARRLLGAEA